MPKKTPEGSNMPSPTPLIEDAQVVHETPGALKPNQPSTSYTRLEDRVIDERTAVIRTSDRGTFKGCRRRWAWSSHLKRNLEPTQAASPLWFGTGFHYALEDMYGFRRFGSASEAFLAYVDATKRQKRQILPIDADEHVEMGTAMLDYYEQDWLIGKEEWPTLVIDGIPQVEVNFIVELPFNPQEYWPDSPYNRVVYSGTIDRVVVDYDGRLWGVDYKSAKQLRTTHFLNDPQASAYSWALYHIYHQEVGGMVWQQHLKTIPKPPEPLKTGKISVAQNQRTSFRLYRRALINRYGGVNKAPAENVKFLNQLAITDGSDSDSYVRRDKIVKNPQSLESEGTKIMLELEDMLNPHVPLYPNPTFMCPSMCPFYEPCVSIDDGSDWEDQLYGETQQRAKGDESWRRYLRLPGEPSNTDTDDIDFSKKDFA